MIDDDSNNDAGPGKCVELKIEMIGTVEKILEVVKCEGRERVEGCNNRSAAADIKYKHQRPRYDDLSMASRTRPMPKRHAWIPRGAHWQPTNTLNINLQLESRASSPPPSKSENRAERCENPTPNSPSRTPNIHLVNITSLTSCDGCSNATLYDLALAQSGIGQLES